MNNMDSEYERAWADGKDSGAAGAGGAQAPARPLGEVDQYSNAWLDDKAGPLEKAVLATGINPMDPQKSLDKREAPPKKPYVLDEEEDQ